MNDQAVDLSAITLDAGAEEEAVLGAMLSNAHAAPAACEILTARDFSTARRGRVFAAMEAMCAASEPIDYLTVAAELGVELEGLGGRDYLYTLAEGCPVATHVRKYASIVRQKSVQRHLYTESQQLANIANDPSFNGDRVAAWRQHASDAADAAGLEGCDSLRDSIVPAASLAEMGGAQVEWAIKGLLAFGSSLSLGGDPKVGKTDYSIAASRAVLYGDEFSGHATTRTGVLLLSEQGPATLYAYLQRHGIESHPSLYVWLYSHVRRDAPWDEIMTAAVAHCLDADLRVMMIDPLSLWSGVDDENDAGEANAVMRPIIRAAAAGLAVWVIRHSRKDGGDSVTSGRGSTAYAASFDVIATLSRAGGGHENRRILKAVGRFEETPPQLVVERTEGGAYVCRGTTADVEQAEVREAVLSMLTGSRDEALTIDEMVEALGDDKRATLARVLGHPGDERRNATGLLADGLVLREKGAGHAGIRAFGYWSSQGSMA